MISHIFINKDMIIAKHAWKDLNFRPYDSQSYALSTKLHTLLYCILNL